MRVFSKKNFEFINPETKEKVRLRNMEFDNVPEWVQVDPLFTWAQQEGSLEVLGEDKPAKTVRKGKTEQPEGQEQ